MGYYCKRGDSMRNRKTTASGVFGAGLAALCGSGAVFVLIVAVGFVMTRVDISEGTVSVLTSAALCVGAYFGGYVAARRRRQSGLMMGTLCGLMMFGLIFAGSYFFAGTAGGFSGSAKLVMTLVCGAVGGVVGVNSKNNWFRLK